MFTTIFLAGIEGELLFIILFKLQTGLSSIWCID